MNISHGVRVPYIEFSPDEVSQAANAPPALILQTLLKVMNRSLLFVLIVLSVSSVAGKKVRYATKVEKQTVVTEKESYDEDCLLKSNIILSTEEKRSFFNRTATSATGKVTLTGSYYTECTPTGANLMEFNYTVEDEIDGTKNSGGVLTMPIVHGLNNATLYLSADLVVRTYACRVEYVLDDDGEYSKYRCSLLVENPAVPFSLNYSMVTYRGASLWQDTSIERGLGYVIKNEEISRCQDEKTSTMDLSVGSDAILVNGEQKVFGNTICKSKNGLSEKFTWIPEE